MVLDNGEDEIVCESLLARIECNSAVLPSREPLIRTHPKSSFRIFVDGKNNVTCQAVVFGKSGERALFQTVESATARTEPQGPLMILENSPHLLFVDRTFRFEGAEFPVRKAIESGSRSDPNTPCAIFVDRKNCITRKSIFGTEPRC